jgi:hypothetical protein
MVELDAEQIAGHRLRAAGLDERAAMGADGFRRAAHAGLPDSWPRAALLSLHARVADVTPSTWEHPSLTQIWGPRFNAYVVAEADVAVFTVGRQPTSGPKRGLGIELADRLDALLGGESVPYRDAGRALGVHPNQLRYAAPTGRVRIRWEGSGAPLVRTVPEPDVDPADARHELLRRFLHVQGPSSASGFGRWAGVAPASAARTFTELAAELTEVITPIGPAAILTSDRDSFDRPADPTGVRLLPGGDNLVLRWDRERVLQVPERAMRDDLWTSRVWPGSLLVDGRLAGTWRRAGTAMTVTAWRPLADAVCDEVEIEASRLPIPGGPTAVRWT